MLLYILELADGKFYVGTTSRSMRVRFKQHSTGAGSAWTKAHTPVHVMRRKIVTQENVYLEEDAEAKRMMLEHGIQNVRGGSYSQKTLSPATLAVLQREMDHARKACMRCGSLKHWASACVATLHVSQGRGGAGSEGEDSETSEASNEEEGEETVNCFRCGRNSHWIADCFAKTHLNGKVLKT